MDKKTLIIVAVLVIVLIFYFPIMEKLGILKDAPSDQKTEQATADSTQIESVIDSSQTAAASIDTIPPSAVAPMETGAAVTDTLFTGKSDTLTVETKKYIVTMTTHGGGPVSILLKDYDYRTGELIEMLPGAKSGVPSLDFAGETFKTSNISFVSNRMAGSYSAESEPFDVVYSYARPEGGEIRKTYRFYPNKYNYDLKVDVIDPDRIGLSGRYNITWNNPLGVTEPQEKIDYDAMQATAMIGGSLEKLDDFNDGKLRQSVEGYTTWAGVRSKYFAAVMIPKSRDAEGVFARGSSEQIVASNGDKITKKEITAGMTLPFVSTFSDSFQVFVGPLDYKLMSSYDIKLQDILDIGTTPFLGLLIKPFAIAVIYMLPWLYKFIPNYGFVIIIFAFLVKLVTLPLSMKSFKSMNAMKEIQPLVDELKKKHAKNPQKMNSEMMALYKKHGVNPISGCLPMLPQMPLFFALFSVFRSTILLRDAPFIFFINDLSRGASSFTDPYIILVVIMVVAQFVSQKLTMSTGQQQKAFLYIMPLFMGYIFHTFAAGLVLYWACFSIFSLMDYFLFKRDAVKNVQVKTV